jgi:hypothetical protein
MNNLLLNFKAKVASQRIAEDMLIELVLDEQAQGHIDKVAMAKAKLEAKGDLELADTLYINHRITRIKDYDYANLAAAQKLKDSTKKDSGLTNEDKEKLNADIILWLLILIPVLIVIAVVVP